MKKILFWGDSPTVPTGFSNVISAIIQNVPKDKYEFVVFGINANDSSDEFGYTIYAANKFGNIYGYDHINDVVEKEKPDIILMVNDIWVINKMVEVLGTTATLVAYFPIDATDHDPAWYSCLDKVSKAVVYNEFGLSVAKKARPDIEYSIIGHGVDNNVFYKQFKSRAEAKKKLFRDPILHNSFIVLNAGRNQPRKRLDITMRAFAKFAKNKRNAFLYMHSGIIDCHIDTLRLAKELDIYDKLVYTSNQHGVQKLTQEDLNFLYNACDVGINTGLGEGFGLPNAEHAATGAPQIVPNHSALTELYKNCGVLVPANILFTLDNISTTARMVAVDDVVTALNSLYYNKKLFNKHAKACYEKFNSEEYSWRYIGNQWFNLFNEL